MSDIFLSYAREDVERVRRLAEALQAQGWSVFWDRIIPPGKAWREVIGTELEQARCMVVAWSHVSITKDWVLEEADEAKVRRILVPVLLDHVQPHPVAFAPFRPGIWSCGTAEQIVRGGGSWLR